MTSLCSLGDLFHICFIDTDEILFLNIYMNSVLKLVFIVIMKIFYTFTLMCLPIKICIILCIRKICVKETRYFQLSLFIQYSIIQIYTCWYMQMSLIFFCINCQSLFSYMVKQLHFQIKLHIKAFQYFIHFVLFSLKVR